MLAKHGTGLSDSPLVNKNMEGKLLPVVDLFRYVTFRLQKTDILIYGSH